MHTHTRGLIQISYATIYYALIRNARGRNCGNAKNKPAGCDAINIFFPRIIGGKVSPRHAPTLHFTRMQADDGIRKIKKTKTKKKTSDTRVRRVTKIRKYYIRADCHRKLESLDRNEIRHAWPYKRASRLYILPSLEKGFSFFFLESADTDPSSPTLSLSRALFPFLFFFIIQTSLSHLCPLSPSVHARSQPCRFFFIHFLPFAAKET